MADHDAAVKSESGAPKAGTATDPKPDKSTFSGKKALAEAPRQIIKFVQGMSRKNKILAVAVIAVILLISILATVLLNRVQYTALYSGLSEEEAGKILSVLQDKGVDAKMNGTSTILVPKEDADDLRVSLAAEGYPQTGLNYDLFTGNSDFGSTDLETRTRLQYTLQENIRTTIKNMDKVKDCIVIVNLATNSSYVVSSNTSEASAAVMLELEPGETLSNDEAVSIAKFVMKSVPKLTMDNISIVDSGMHSYDLSDGSDSANESYTATQVQLSEQMKKILSSQALNVLEPAVGSGNVAVSVNLTLDFDKETQNSVEFSPPVEGETDGMLRSLQENTDASNSGSGTNGSAGTDSNGVSGTEYVAPSGANGNSSNSSSKTYNYELNELKTEIEKAQGKVTDLSVSVLLNSDAKGTTDAANKAKDLVANAIGVDPQYITIESMPFVESAGAKSFDDYYAQNQSSAARAGWFGIAKIALLCLTLLLAVFLVLRFLKKGKPEEKEFSQEFPKNGTEVAEGQGDKDERLLADLVQTKSDETEKVEKLIEDYPQAAVQILRNWLSDD